VTLVIVVYTLRGGLRAVAWTDLFQGVVMFMLLLASLVIVARYHGGFIEANHKLLSANPDLFSRPGGTGKYTYGIWFSFIMLWFFCDPMFPQLFQRFFSAKNPAAIGRTMLFYPLICTVVFFLPISVGVLGHLSFPDLVGKEADKILPMTMTLISGDFMASLVIAAGLAALMSTMDSQLLTLSSIFTRDILPLVNKRKSQTSLSGRLFVIGLSVAGLVLAYKPPATILQIATQTFTGLAVLFPTVIFGLYLKRVYAVSAILSIICGEGMMVLFYFKLVPSGPFLPVIWVMAVTFAVYLVTHLLCNNKMQPIGNIPPSWVFSRYFVLMSAVFILGMDFWAWKKSTPLIFGVPWWMGYFVFLSLVQTVGMVLMVRTSKK